MLSSKLIWICLISVFFFGQLCFASETTPEPGGVCTEPDAIYNYSAGIAKTPWKPHELYAIPVGTLDPLIWESSPEFKNQFLAVLQSGQSAEAFAQACAAVWQNFFSSDAVIVITLNRKITISHKTLKCIAGVWETVNSENLQIDDVSDWLAIGSAPFNVTNPESVALLETEIENILTNLNAQPGAN